MALKHSAGYGLLETMAAAAVALTLVAAVSGVIVAAQRLTTAAAVRARVATAATSEWEALRVLPLESAREQSLVSRVFPHADSTRNTSRAWYSAAPTSGCPAGSFFTCVQHDGVELRIGATFVVLRDGEWQSQLPRATLEGKLEPPTAHVLVRISEAGSRPEPVIVSILPSATSGGSPSPATTAGP